MTLELSVVIPVHDAGLLLDEQVAAVLASIHHAKVSAEVVLVDDGSTDGAVGRAVARHSGGPTRVTVVEVRSARGPSHARNRGIAAATADRIALCDADDLVSLGWAGALAGALGPETPYVTGPLDIDRLNPPRLRDSRGRSVYEDVPLLAGVVPFAHGCNLGLHRSLVDAIGGFDETLRVAEDIEFGVRAWRSGVRLAWRSEARVAYRFRGDWRAAYRQGRDYGRSAAVLVASVPELPRSRVSWAAEVRRAAWLGRTALKALRGEGDRARWLWTLSQLDGRLRGAVGARQRRRGQVPRRSTTSS